jgi:hypothetical protein
MRPLRAVGKGGGMRFSTLGWFTVAAAVLCWHSAHASKADAQAEGEFAEPGLAQRILASADHRGLPFAIVDKKTATLTVYLADGRLIGATPVLLGQTPGDRSVPGVGERAQSGQLRADDRTTPAGRFASEPGHNLAGEAIVWIDYPSALAIHRVRPGRSQERRVQGLASPDARDRRLSAGCVVVPEAFFDAVVRPVLGRGPGVVYVMPEVSATTIVRQAQALTQL